MTISVIVCAYNEATHIAACLHALLAQTRPPDEILVIDNASTDGTGHIARSIRGVRVIAEPTRGLVVARETGRREARGDVLAYVDADCRTPILWLQKITERFERRPALVAVTGPYRFYDWDRLGRLLIRGYDGEEQGVWPLRPQLLVGDSLASTRGPHAPGRKGLTCQATSRFFSAIFMSTQRGATADSRCATSSISTARRVDSTS